jgi:hypothetical protein
MEETRMTPTERAQQNQLKRLYVELPYGLWAGTDGREILFNRNYEALWVRRPGQPAQRARPEELKGAKFHGNRFIYQGPYYPLRQWLRETVARCEAVLRDWGVQSPAADAGRGDSR